MRQQSAENGQSPLPFCSVHHRGGGPFQQWVVYYACRMEHERLQYERINEATLRQHERRGLSDALQRGQHPEDVGRTVTVLSYSFTGSPRYMTRRYLDAMAIVRHFGKPDLFLTFTFNPNWPETHEAFLDGQQPSDRPEIVSRFSRLKLKAFEDGLFQNQCMEKVAARVRVIEFQKRGLPHAHILIILAQEDKTMPE